MNSSQRTVVQEVLEACRIHEKAVYEANTSSLHTDLNDVEEGLGISATKLEELLKVDACDKKLEIKLLAKLNWFIKTAQAREAKFRKAAKALITKNPFNSLFDHGDLVEATAILDAFIEARWAARRGIKDGRNPVDHLRSWASTTLESLTVITKTRPIQGILEDVNKQNGIKMAVRAVTEYLDMGIRL